MSSDNSTRRTWSHRGPLRTLARCHVSAVPTRAVGMPLDDTRQKFRHSVLAFVGASRVN
jgi:hypothetical protein